MIGAFLIIAEVILQQTEVMTIRAYGRKNNNNRGGMFFNAIICMFAMLYFIVTDKNGLQFIPEICIYGAANSLMYATGFYAVYLALKWGSFGLTRVFNSFGIIITTFYGIMFLKEPSGVLTYVALALFVISLSMMNYQKQVGAGQKITLKWVICIILNIFANALIGIIGRMQFGEFGDDYKNEYLIISLGGATVFLLVLGIIFERDTFKSTVKLGFLYGAGAGICNAIKNLLVLITYNYLPVSFSSPVRAGLNMVVGFLVATTIYKERFCKRQIISVVAAIIAIVLMNIK